MAAVNPPPTILISGTIGEETSAAFTVGSPEGLPRTLFAQGLGAGEAVLIDILTADTASPGAGDWLAASIAGSAQQLTTTDNVGIIASPGRYRVRIASSAGAVRIGLY